ncbi:flavin dependent monooxygenase [Patellaria atrata CBS 101060]|uniref:Flavin dependent monooxygenase n=1 Tax=Patellaria atrata CBS 101060 TaxID=1346257 RepID=A0A9P4VTU5_9PEZI|nr:flavin dependent monooxygenase [Patellaria atrata CBS 101060]
MTIPSTTTSQSPQFNVRKIAIIGAGPSGLAAAKYLRAEQALDEIVIIEQRDCVGGLWNYTPDYRTDSTFNVPNLDPNVDLNSSKRNQKRQNRGTGGPNGGTPSEKIERGDGIGMQRRGKKTFVSPIYERLETNIPRTLMGFSDHEFPDESQLFPGHKTVLKYLEEYAEDVRDLIRFNVEVVDVRLRGAAEGADGSREKWVVSTISTAGGGQCEDVYDAVVVASGHFNVPFIPDIVGITEWDEMYPGVISHSKFYRKPEELIDKKVIVVGNSASGLDIGSQIATFSKLPLICSQRSESYLQLGPADYRKDVPPIAQFIPKSRTVVFDDGTRETDIDAIVFCTGYLYSYPFLSSLNPPLITHGARVENTYQHLFYAPHPTLSLLVLNQKVIPFPVAEVQSAVLARVYSNRLRLPSYTEMRDWESRTVAEKGSTREFHLLKFPDDAEYINLLYDWAASTPNVTGKMPPRWGQWQYWARERFPAIRKAFVQEGEGRKNIRTIKELGFDFEEWKKEERENEDGSKRLL